MTTDETEVFIKKCKTKTDTELLLEMVGYTHKSKQYLAAKVEFEGRKMKKPNLYIIIILTMIAVILIIELITLYFNFYPIKNLLL